MDEKSLAIYCMGADILKALGHVEDPQHQVCDAEVITTAWVAMLFFRGNFESARALLSSPHSIPPRLNRSRLNRRLHRLKELLVTLFELLGQPWKDLTTESIYVIESFPIPVCDNYRIPRAKLYQQEDDRGYIASKKRYCYGLKIHLLMTKGGQPVECILTPSAYSDVRVLKLFRLDLPEDSWIDTDTAYDAYDLEDLLLDAAAIQLCPMRKTNATRALPPWIAYVQHYYRKKIETVGSLIERLLPKSIHAVTASGFELKVFLFVLA
jgi:Transposase DDE domain